jgi:leader peptidase (prepilin peptidase) / N-methyltransferase
MEEWLNSLDSNALHMIVIAYWMILTFVLGTAIGSFVNVAVARLPYERSLLWPGSRCGVCQQPIRWYDNLPLISYLRLRGRCRSCGSRFSGRYFWVELSMGVSFAGLFFLEIFHNVHGWPGRFFAMPAWPWIAGYAYHATLFTLLVAASVCDLRTCEIPIGITMTGTIIGLIGAVLFAWPWPAAPPPPPAPIPLAWQRADQPIPAGIYAWPFWGPLPEFFAPGDNWQTGLATGILGALAGTFLMRGVGFLFGTGFGKESMGLGDADLMMMVGAFLGWQLVLAAFFLSIVPALVLGVVRVVARGENALTFGPPLSLGAMTACLGWFWIGRDPIMRAYLFNGTLMMALAAVSAALLLAMAFLMRLIRA